MSWFLEEDGNEETLQTSRISWITSLTGRIEHVLLEEHYFRLEFREQRGEKQAKSGAPDFGFHPNSSRVDTF